MFLRTWYKRKDRKKIPVVVLFLLVSAIIVMYETHLTSPVNLSTRLNDNKLRFTSSFGIPSYQNSSKYVYFVCDKTYLCGGYADRQKGIVGAYIISLMMKRSFAISFTTPCNLNLMFEPNLVHWDVNPKTLGHASYRKIRSLDGVAMQLRNELISMDLEKSYKEDVLFFSFNMELVEYLRQNVKYKMELKWLEHLSVSEIYAIVWNRLFKIKPHIEERLRPFIALKEQGLQFIGAQIRIGRSLTLPSDSDIRNTVNSTQTLWNFYQQYTDSSKYRIFISTDNEEVRLEALKRFPEVFIDVSGPISHIERSRGNQVCEGFRKAILDQIVLSMCDILVVSKSGFGRVAAFFRNNENGLYCFNKNSISRCTTQSSAFGQFNW